jgi:hypothetical protein
MPITLNGDTGITTPSYGGTDTSEYLVPVTAFKNRIINGAMQIDQRNAGASVTFSSQYTVDRWVAVEDSDGAMTAQQISDAPVGFTKSLRFTTTTADASLGATQYVSVSQFIEGFNTSDLAWGTANASTITISFWVKSSLTGTFGGSLRNGDYNRSYSFTYTISASNTWEQKTITIAGDTTGTWATDNNASIRLAFGLGVGSTFSGTAGSWSGSNFVSSTGATSVIGTLNATWQVTGVQLEKGSTATSFDYRPYGTELQLCERYYEVIAGGDISGGAFSASNLFAGIRFRTVKRSSATMTSITNGSWVGNGGLASISSVSFSNIGLYGCQMDSTSFSGSVTQGYAYNFRNVDYRASAEL